MNTLKNKIALITGGTTGIGLATAKLFVNEGARVIVTGRTAETIKSAQSELGDNAIVMHSDLVQVSGERGLVVDGLRKISARSRQRLEEGASV